MKKSVLAVFAAVSLSVSPALLASPSYYLQARGFTSFDATDLAAAGAAYGIEVNALAGTQATGAAVFKFPIVGGGIDAGTLTFEAVHQGGFTLTDGTNTVTLNSPIIDVTGSTPSLSMLITENGSLQGRFTVGYVQVPSFSATVTSGTRVKLKHLPVTLAPAVVAELNQAFGMTVVSANQTVAVVTLKFFAGDQLP